VLAIALAAGGGLVAGAVSAPAHTSLPAAGCKKGSTKAKIAGKSV
jgi:hypothetical protein